MSIKYRIAIIWAVMAVTMLAPIAMAADAGAVAADEGRYSGFFSFIALGAVVGLGLAAGGGGIGMGNAVSGAVNAMARNPGFYGRIFTNMLIGLALIESLVIYTLVVVLLLLYANPFL
ncbi:MAG TPA: ATP synthase F0 subunit C [Nitrospinota bacterium]|nr:ATP synthase F0 subunit C [Nitrospinota bacterium]